MIKCKLCNKEFRVISNTHLLSVHKTSLKNYIRVFGHQKVGFTVNVASLPKNDPRYINWRGSLKKRDTGWARGYTKETHPSLAKIAQTFRQKGIDNFKNWREKQRELGLIPSTSKPLQRDKNLAFLMGLVLGDGNISKFPRTECLRITLAEKYPKLITYTKSVIRKVFGKTPNTRKVKGSACYIITMYQNNISGRLGIPIGDRSNFNFCIPDWIFNKRAFLISFLKGLFEAEGSLSIHLPTYTYNFQFSNKNHSLLKCVRESLELLGYHPEVRSVAVRLRKKTEVESFRQLIKFRFC